MQGLPLILPLVSFLFVYFFVLCYSYCFSDGVGRTGSFICIDNVLDQIEKEQVVDIAGAINKMRHHHMKMVQTVVSTIHIVVPKIIDL